MERCNAQLAVEKPPKKPRGAAGLMFGALFQLQPTKIIMASSLLQPLGNGPGYLKAGFLGFTASGKTTTAALLAIAMKRHAKHAGPIAFLDTETGSDYITPLLKGLSGVQPIGVKTRSFDDLLSVGDECVAAGVSVLIVDSVTHLWRSLCDSYLAGVNNAREQMCIEKNWRFKPRTNLEFQDWNPIKATWARWTDFYLTSPLNIIICGRAGFEYDFETNEQGKRELIKTGTKMKTESEFGFEASLLVEMEVEPEKTQSGGFRQVRTAFIRKDRFNVMDGLLGRFPNETDNEKLLASVAEFFAPHLTLLNPDAHTTTRLTGPAMNVDAGGADEWARERDRRTILSEEIQGMLTSHVPGMGAEDKKRKADLLQKYFGTRSWTAVESTASEKLRAGLKALKDEFESLPLGAK